MKWTLWFTLLGLNILDVWTTSEMFARGGYEANPLLGNNLTRIIVFKLIVLTVIYLLVRRASAKWVPFGLLATVVIYAVVVGVNLGGMAAA